METDRWAWAREGRVLELVGGRRRRGEEKRERKCTEGNVVKGQVTKERSRAGENELVRGRDSDYRGTTSCLPLFCLPVQPKA